MQTLQCMSNDAKIPDKADPELIDSSHRQKRGIIVSPVVILIAVNIILFLLLVLLVMIKSDQSICSS